MGDEDKPEQTPLAKELKDDDDDDDDDKFLARANRWRTFYRLLGNIIMIGAAPVFLAADYFDVVIPTALLYILIAIGSIFFREAKYHDGKTDELRKKRNKNKK